MNKYKFFSIILAFFLFHNLSLEAKSPRCADLLMECTRLGENEKECNSVCKATVIKCVDANEYDNAEKALLKLKTCKE